ncbi:MAG TPA: CPBP family intramembrane glutamic endopeptidase [Pirellulaceae bacterium]|nr:CPBP family intramembrane glutamic endopeptidase [Pirellulaceae bacterium]
MRALEFITAPLATVDTEHRAYLAERPVGQLDWRALVILLSVPCLLTLREYCFSGSQCWQLIALLEPLAAGQPWLESALEIISRSEQRRLTELAYWSLGQVLCFLLLPALIVRGVLRESLNDYGLKLRGLLYCWWAYLGMFLVMLPFLLFMATTKEFQATYPFYQPHPSEPLWPRFFIWQMFYATQFVALEFFFRGYMIHGLKRQLGVYCILAMTIPYCMIHYGKPLPETLGSIGAGVILGFMSLKTRSIWLGAALHIAVAITMDVAALGNARSH